MFFPGESGTGNVRCLLVVRHRLSFGMMLGCERKVGRACTQSMDRYSETNDSAGFARENTLFKDFKSGRRNCLERRQLPDSTRPQHPIYFGESGISPRELLHFLFLPPPRTHKFPRGTYCFFTSSRQRGLLYFPLFTVDVLASRGTKIMS